MAVKSSSLIKDIMETSARLKLEAAASLPPVIDKAALLIMDTLKNDGKVLFCGNGGSAADCQHIAAEMVGRFQKERKGFAAVALTTDSSILTSVSNDYGYSDLFRRQVEALGRPDDVLVGISTSGKSENVIRAFKAAKGQGMKIIAMVGADVTMVSGIADVVISVPSTVTARIQEVHITVGHILCELIENEQCDDADRP